ncbi:MAG: hypothetical protein AAGI69_29470 [Cyanobacteria bacterium P01_H01_bin.21]
MHSSIVSQVSYRNLGLSGIPIVLTNLTDAISVGKGRGELRRAFLIFDIHEKVYGVCM